MKLIESKEDLQSWDGYREAVTLQLKALEGAGQPFCISKEKVDFEVDGKPWRGHAVLAGPKGVASVRKLQTKGVVFREGTCSKQGKELQLDGLDPKLAKEAAKTLKKLRAIYQIAGVEAEEEASAPGSASPATPAASGAPGAAAAAQGDLAKRAEKIAKASDVWTKTGEVATKELRKLQKELLALGDARTKPVIQGLEDILKRIDKVDDEAKVAVAAAESGDAVAFGKARETLIGKLNGILSFVQQDEMIRLADANPLTEVKVQETYTKSLNQLIKSI